MKLKVLSTIIIAALLLTPCSAERVHAASVPIVTNERKIEKLPNLPKHIKKNNEIVPKGWSLLDTKKNDFNGDGLKDLVGVIEPPINNEKMYPRILFVYFNTGDGYNLNLVNPYIIRNNDEGGIYGDPYQELTVKNNTFTTNAYGGSAWRWSENNTFEYKDEQWYLLSAESYYGYGDFETSYKYDDYNTGIGIRRETEEAFDKKNPKKLKYKVKLNQQPLLNDFVYTLGYGIERRKAPKIKSVSYTKGMEPFEIMNLKSSVYDNLAQNKDYIVYSIKQSDDVSYIGILSLRTKNLQMIARYDARKQKEGFSDFRAFINNNRIYYQEDINKNVSIRSEGKITQSKEIVAVQLISRNLDGTDKKIIFKALHPKYKENKIIEDYLGYLSLNYEITGDEIIAMVYRGKNHPYYRMNLQGENKSLIGTIPNEEY